MKYGELITKDYPIVLGKTFDIDPSLLDLEEYFDAIDQYLASTTGPYVFISVSEGARYMSSETRIHIGKLAGKLTEKYKDRNKGSIIVTNGVMAAMMLKAIALVYKPLQDNIIVKSLDDAYTKAKEVLAKELVK